MSSSSAPPQPSPSSPIPHNNGSSATSNLYLVTFLATLFLLLLVSCAIVMRSYLLRRRYQRQLDDALAAGLLLAPRTLGSKKKRFGFKPAIQDAWLATPASGSKWNTILPLSAQPVFVKRKYRDVPKSGHASSPAQLVPPSSPAWDTPSQDAPSARGAIPSFFFRRHAQTLEELDAETAEENDTDAETDPSRSPTSPTSPTVPSVVGTSSTSPVGVGGVTAAIGTAAGSGTGTSAPTSVKVRVEMLQIAVLVAMPNASTSRHYAPPSPERVRKPRLNRLRTSAVSAATAPRNIEVEKKRVCSIDEDLDELMSSDDEKREYGDEDEAGESEVEGWGVHGGGRLPELVFGVTRVHYRHSTMKPGDGGKGLGASMPPNRANPVSPPPTRSNVAEAFLLP